uniref:Uncharacterized protein n=1 Tax=Macrostomum lignano TaxID=282301 RepID=A0A1I8JPI3_9PLAT
MAKEGEEAKVEVDLVNRDHQPAQWSPEGRLRGTSWASRSTRTPSTACGALLTAASLAARTAATSLSASCRACASPCAWGCTFAMVAFSNIWCITPCTQGLQDLHQRVSGRCGRPTGTLRGRRVQGLRLLSSAGSRSNRARLLPTARKAAAWSLAA